MRFTPTLILFAAAMLAAAPAEARTVPATDFYCEVWHAYYPEVMACPVPWSVAPAPRPQAFGEPARRKNANFEGRDTQPRKHAGEPAFNATGDGLDEWCARARSPSSIAICSDVGLRALALDRQRALEQARLRLAPEQQKLLLANESAWVKAYSAACGLPRSAAPALPLAASVKNCMAEAGRSRLAYLDAYKRTAAPEPLPAPVNPASAGTMTTPASATAVPPPKPPRPTAQRATESPPAPGKQLSATSPVVGSKDEAAPVSNAAPAAGATRGADERPAGVGVGEARIDRGMLVALALAGLAAVALAVALVQRRRPAARHRRQEIEGVCQYFDRLNQTRTFPAVDVPGVLEPGEFGLLSAPARLHESATHRFAPGAGGLKKVAGALGALWLKYFSHPRTIFGNLTLTNRRVLFDSAERMLQFRMVELADAKFDGYLRLTLRPGQQPVVLSLEQGELAALLIRSFADGIFRDRRLPDGLTIAAGPTARADGVDLRLQLPRLIHLAHAMAQTDVGPSGPAAAAAAPAAEVPRLAPAEL